MLTTRPIRLQISIPILVLDVRHIVCTLFLISESLVSLSATYNILRSIFLCATCHFFVVASYLLGEYPGIELKPLNTEPGIYEYINKLNPRPKENGDSMPHSKELSNNSHPGPNQPNSRYQY